MSCCKAEEYKWCAGEPVVYTDEQERGYCVFHAPAGKKGSASKEFEEKVFSRIKSGQLCDLSGTVFEDISFRKYDKNNPLPEISFHNATFSGKADFLGATFSGDADFSNAKFSGGAFFTGGAFSGGAGFSNATFSGEANYSVTTFSGEADFSNAAFSGDVYFSGARFSKENGIADFSGATFSGKAYFSEATFNRKAYFFRATFNSKTVFHGDTFFEGGDFRDISINEQVRFDGVDLTKVSFMDTDLRRMDFRNCTWPQKKGYDLLYDEIEIYEKLKESGAGRFKAFFHADDEKFGKVETLYRCLKQKYKEEHDEQRASHWHFCEKEMFRKRNLWRRFFGLTALYGVSSGYGELPFRAFIFLLFLITIFSSLQGLFGVDSFPGESIYGIEKISGYFDMDYRAFGALVLNTIQYATFQKVTEFKPASPLGGFIKSLTQVALPVQAALFALAIRNRLRR